MNLYVGLNDKSTPITILDDILTFYHWIIYMIPCRSSVFMGGANTNLEQDKLIKGVTV